MKKARINGGFSLYFGVFRENEKSEKSVISLFGRVI